MKNKNNSKQNFYPACLTVGGSDSRGGAGIQADLRTFNAFAVYGCSAITGVNIYDGRKSAATQAIDCDVVASEIDAILSEIPIKFAKSGALINPDTIKIVAEKIEKYQINLIAELNLNAGNNAMVIEAMKKYLLPKAKVITGNIMETELLLGEKISSEKDLINAARKLAKIYKADVILKNNSFQNKNEVADIVVLESEVYRLKSPYLKNCHHLHGADCTFSAALCANLALGTPLDDSILEAKTFVFGSLAEPVRIGNNCEVMYPPELDYSEHISLIGI
jgi:hydroxymethylpyrimidine/phosphomethylpyrimidine kinase